MEPFLTLEGLAEMLRVKRSTIYAWVYLRKIPHYKVGRLLRFKTEEINQWLEEHREEVYRFSG